MSFHFACFWALCRFIENTFFVSIFFHLTSCLRTACMLLCGVHSHCSLASHPLCKLTTFFKKKLILLTAEGQQGCFQCLAFTKMLSVGLFSLRAFVTVGEASGCSDGAVGRAAHVQNPLSVGPRDLSALWALGGGTPTPARSHTGHCQLVVPWCGFLHLSLKQRERTWQLLCFQTAAEN